MKTCKTCQQSLSLDQFRKLSKSRDGLSYDCRKCGQESAAKWREKNRHKVRAYTAKWRDKVGKDLVNENAKIYREANREKTRQAALKWQKENPGKANAANAARYAAKMRATPKWADMDAVERFYVLAEQISQSTLIKYEVDHIVPLRSKVVCGLHCEYNLQVIPAFENRSKGNRSWPDMP